MELSKRRGEDEFCTEIFVGPSSRSFEKNAMCQIE